MATVLAVPTVLESDEPVTRLGPESNGMLMTSEEFEAVTDAKPGYRYELIRGIVIVCPIPGPASRDANGELEYLLRQYRDTHPNGNSLDHTLPENYVRVGKDRRIVDRAIWCGLGRRPNPNEDVPTIAVEFVSA